MVLLYTKDEVDKLLAMMWEEVKAILELLVVDEPAAVPNNPWLAYKVKKNAG